MESKYKYNEATVKFYDLVYEKLADKGRFAFYQEEISKSKGPVLEAGAGTGMIFVPALKNGADIYGIDHSEYMFKALRSKLDEKDHHRISLQDIREFKLEKKFNLIISPFRVFQHLITIEDQLQALGRIYEHLENEGLLIFDLFCPDTNRLKTEVNNDLEFEGEFEPGKKARRYATVIPDYINQVQNVTFKYVWDSDNGEQMSEYSFPMRYYFRFEIMNLLKLAKFKVKHFYGDFRRSKLSNSSKEFVIVCSKL